jgi:hypothetical protein
MNSRFKQWPSAGHRCSVIGWVICAWLLGAQAVAAQPSNEPLHQGKHLTAHAVKPEVQSFDETTWAHLLRHGPRPAAYLFTTSYCSTCPAAFAVLQAAVKNRSVKPELTAVMMDVSGPLAWRHARHFKGMTRMYAFDGFEPAIRQSVDPAWPNVTPYVVMVDLQGQTQRVIGPPSPEMLKRWLAVR